MFNKLYSFNLNAIYFHSTQIFIQLQPKLFFFNTNIRSTSTQNIFLQHKYSINFNQNYFSSTQIFIQLQRKIFFFNTNIQSTSTETIFLQHKYSINFNQNYFSSTQIFIQLQRKIFFFKPNIHSTSTQTVFIQQKKYVSPELLYLKFPDIPNVYSSERSTHRASLLGCVVKMATDEDRLTQIVRECVRNEMALKRSGSAINASLLSRTRNLISMRPDRRAILTWPKMPDVAPAERQRLSRISKTNTAITFIKKCVR